VRGVFHPGRPAGKFARYKIVELWFQTWMDRLAMHRRQISDFPLGNKSFTLSCRGHDR
jgi:hypothetical protein